jgi:hypothetical protein
MMMTMELTELMGFIENPYTALILSSAKRKGDATNRRLEAIMPRMIYLSP